MGNNQKRIVTVAMLGMAMAMYVALLVPDSALGAPETTFEKSAEGAPLARAVNEALEKYTTAAAEAQRQVDASDEVKAAEAALKVADERYRKSVSSGPGKELNLAFMVKTEAARKVQAARGSWSSNVQVQAAGAELRQRQEVLEAGRRAWEAKNAKDAAANAKDAAANAKEINATHLSTIGDQLRNQSVKLSGCSFAGIDEKLVSSDGWVGFKASDASENLVPAFADKRKLGWALGWLKDGAKINLTGKVDRLRDGRYAVFCDQITNEDGSPLNQDAAMADKAGKVDLLRLIKPERDAIQYGQWTFQQDGSLLSGRLPLTKLRIPYAPPEEYDFRVGFTPAEANDAVVLDVWVGQQQLAFVLGGWGNKVCGFEYFDGVSAADLPGSLRAEAILQAGKKYVALVKVRKDFVSAYLDDKLVQQLRVESDRYSTEDWQVGPNALGLGTYMTPTSFHQVEVIEISGKGKTQPTVAQTGKRPGRLQRMDRAESDGLLGLVTQYTLPMRVGHDDVPSPTQVRDEQGNLRNLADGLWGQNDVFMIHPVTRTLPALVDFGAICARGAGILRLQLHGDPRGDCRAVVLLDDRPVREFTLSGDRWVPVEIPFEKGSRLVLQNQANGWNCEYMFVTYQVELSGNAKPPIDHGNAPKAPFLADLPEQVIEVECGKLGKNTDRGFEREKLSVNGAAVQHGLSTHPPEKGSARVMYLLPGDYEVFRAKVAIGDESGRAGSPLTFRVRGDGKDLWRSGPIQGHKQVEECEVSVKGVKKLELMVDCPGSANSAHAVWVDPCLR